MNKAWWNKDVCTKKIKSNKEKVYALREKSLLNGPWKINEQEARRKINYPMAHIIVSLKTILPWSSCQPTNFQTPSTILGNGQMHVEEVQEGSAKKDAWCALMICVGCCNSTTHTDTGSVCSVQVIRVLNFFA
jgi:hypothetical protein